MSINFKQITLGVALLTGLSSSLLSSASIARNPTPISPPPTGLPPTEPPLFSGPGTISVEDFNYKNGGRDFPENSPNRQYFNGCFRKVYSLLGVSDQTGLPNPSVISSATTALSPPLTPTQVSNTSYVGIGFRYASQNKLNVHLSATIPQSTIPLFTIPITRLDRTSGYCSHANINLTSMVKTISAEYGIPLVYSVKIQTEYGMAGFNDFAVRLQAH
jgi:hypothetical protein